MDITAIPVGWSAGGLLALVVLFVIRGDIIPRKWHDETRTDRDKEREARHAQDARLDKQTPRPPCQRAVTSSRSSASAPTGA